jgi:hypothetical protein
MRRSQVLTKEHRRPIADVAARVRPLAREAARNALRSDATACADNYEHPLFRRDHHCQRLHWP